MFGLWHFRNASGRVWMLILLGLVVMWGGDYVVGWAFQYDPPGAHASTPQDEELSSQVQDAMVASQIQKVSADGRWDFLLGPAAAAAAFGGVILLVGGTGAALMWRRASEGDR